MISIRNYALVTSAYWGLTLTDGALRMLVLLHFHQLGFTPFEIAFLFLLYEVFGVITNLLGGWIAARSGLRVTLFGGLVLQIFALLMLMRFDPSWGRDLSIFYVLMSQGLSGIAKDLTKLSAKAAIKTLVAEDAKSALFKWVAALTGSKNALKGIGFFLGSVLLASVGFSSALLYMAGALFLIVGMLFFFLRGAFYVKTGKLPFTEILSKSRAINVLSMARFFLFGGRDVWFVIGIPLFLSEYLHWSHIEIGTFMAVWVIVYGGVQMFAPKIIRKSADGLSSEAPAAALWAWGLAVVPIAMLFLLVIIQNSNGIVDKSEAYGVIVVVGLGVFGLIFAINSSLHSYLILAYSDSEQIAADVGFYYMANAGGRLVGTLMSGYLYQLGGVSLCLMGAALMIALSAMLAHVLPTRSLSAS